MHRIDLYLSMSTHSDNMWVVLICLSFVCYWICRSYSKWNYHWSLVSNGEFKRVTSAAGEAEKNKPKIKFKVVPPPPKPKPPPPPPPPPPNKPALPKPHRPKRTVEVDVFRLCWRESWMTLKPPKYLYLKAKELKARIPGFVTIKLPDHRKYKLPKEYGSEAEWVFPADKWSHSWKQVLRQTKTGFMLKYTKTQSPCYGWSVWAREGVF